MSANRFAILMLCLTLFICPASLAQGCSDAGFCSLPALKPQDTTRRFVVLKQQAAVGFAFGKGDHEITILTPYLLYERRLAPDVLVLAKLTFSAASGELGKQSGLGDLLFSGSYVLNSAQKAEWRITAGGKIPLSRADAGDERTSLPMDYQSSLASYDLLLGVSYVRAKLDVSLGLQQPLSGENSNTFLPEDYPDANAGNYQPANRFNRAGDLLMRIAYRIPLGSRCVIKPGLLPIYHIAKDTYVDRAATEQEIEGSAGLTLNGNVFLAYQVSSHHAIELALGMPLLVRKTRPDGLTRTLALGIEYRIAF